MKRDALEDTLEIVRALVELPSRMPASQWRDYSAEIEDVERRTWKLLATNPDAPELGALAEQLQAYVGVLRKTAIVASPGRPFGTLAKDKQERDRAVFEAMTNGLTQAAAIRKVYGTDVTGSHKRRISRRKKLMFEIAKFSEERGH